MSDRVLGTCAIEFRGREPARRLVEEAGFEFVHQLGSPPGQTRRPGKSWPDSPASSPGGSTSPRIRWSLQVISG